MPVKLAAVYGGASMDTQVRDLKKGAQIVVGTPGRVMDLIKRRKLLLEGVKWMVLDEADEMLNMGFKEDLDTILAETPAEKQTLLFSATMPPEIASIAKKYMDKPEEIAVGKKNEGAENVKHIFYMVQARDRYQALKRIADINPSIYGIVFCRTRQETKDVAEKLMQDNYNADALHGDLSQAQRDQVMGRFRSGHLQILVATDVAARGLDVTDLTHVINYNLPDDPEVYVHRSGRTGRAGKSGVSIAIVHSREMGKIKHIEKMLNKKFSRELVPNGRDICERQLFNLVDKVENVKVDETEIKQYLEVIYKKLSWLSREELIQRFVSVEFNRFLEFYKDAQDINVKDSKSRERDGREQDDDRRGGKRSRGDMDFTRFFINMGEKNKINHNRLMGLINEHLPKRGVEIGKIEILRNFSFFELDTRFAKDLVQGMKNASFDGQAVKIEISEGKMEEKPYKPFPKSRKRTSSAPKSNKGKRRFSK